MVSFESMGDRPSVTYHYTEMQATETYQEPTDNESLADLISSLIVFFITFGVLFLFFKYTYRYSRKMLTEQKATADENTEAIKLNNGLLREQIELQREILEALRRKEA